MRRSVAACAAVVVATVSVLPTAGIAADADRPGSVVGCAPAARVGWSVARAWDEVLLDAIRRDFPAPGVHARNLFHTSAGMYDAWAAYDPIADGYFVDEHHTATDVQAAREQAISFAAYRILVHRYGTSIAGEEDLREFDALMASLCLDPAYTGMTGADPASLGNRIAAAIIAFGETDGSLEAQGYTSPTYVPVNEPLIVTKPGAKMADPNRWQPLALDFQETQNGQALPDKVQTFVGPFWGHVASFGLMTNEQGLPLDPGKPPALGKDKALDQAYKRQAVDVIRKSGMLDPRDGVTIDISPASMGNSHLGTNDGEGYSINPVTGEPYAPVIVPRADYARALAEFWADGPQSETPPGHWNVVANAVGDAIGEDLRIGGTGPVVDRLEWDVKTYFALNGAVHDAAVAAWGAKGYYDTARPISMIRYMAGQGQSTSRRLPRYSPRGLPLVPGVVELITPYTVRKGGKFEHLKRHVGKLAIKAWAGNPADPTAQIGGVEWQLATEWVPYQKPTFVTPAFSGYVSGHSTFSRAAAEVMTAMTGSAFFPGGVGQFTVPAGSLDFELGPTVDVPLQWATYYDAADQAGLSRLYGGIHISADDLAGRVTGSQCGKIAWRLASSYFLGDARI
jgi:hypothetical protein